MNSSAADTPPAPTVPLRVFVAPGRVLAGPGSSASIGAEVAALASDSDRQVIVVADGAVLELGLVDAVVTSMAEAGYELRICPPITGEPTPEMVRAGSATVSSHTGVAAVVAIGGGSALDAAKLVALSLANDLDLEVGLRPVAAVVPGPPVVAVPTTAGTGSEVTEVAMLWHEGAKRMFVHRHLVPAVAVLDPDLLRHLPPDVTASSGLDAISHAVESLLSTFRTRVTEGPAQLALRKMAQSLVPAHQSGDPIARLDTLVAAHQAGLALNASVVLGHSLAYTIGARTNLPHGVTCAMALPYCLTHCRSARDGAIAEMAEIVCGDRDSSTFLRWIVELNEAMGIPLSLGSVGLSRDQLQSMARECVELYPRPNHPTAIHEEDVLRLLEAFFTGEIDEIWRAAGKPHKRRSIEEQPA